LALGEAGDLPQAVTQASIAHAIADLQARERRDVSLDYSRRESVKGIIQLFRRCLEAHDSRKSYRCFHSQCVMLGNNVELSAAEDRSRAVARSSIHRVPSISQTVMTGG
jgi:hypothetical protein